MNSENKAECAIWLLAAFLSIYVGFFNYNYWLNIALFVYITALSISYLSVFTPGDRSTLVKILVFTSISISLYCFYGQSFSILGGIDQIVFESEITPLLKRLWAYSSSYLVAIIWCTLIAPIFLKVGHKNPWIFIGAGAPLAIYTKDYSTAAALCSGMAVALAFGLFIKRYHLKRKYLSL